MKAVIKAEKLRESVGKYLDAQLAQQREIRDYWSAMHNTGEGNSSLHARNMTEAQDCVDFLMAIKRGVTCTGCKERDKASGLEFENQMLRQENKDLKADLNRQNR